ncbi:hypothetical protein BGZ76_010422 [Entomortierella beljakovae]|nr:hypothetical protein BGZ76_010422 [Entomortierella beljakovae]
MGPLELEREIDSGIHLNIESALSSPTILPKLSQSLQGNDPLNTATELLTQRQHLSHQLSTSTLVSETSRPSSTTTKRTDQDNDPDGMAWSGAHPLLIDYSAEPESLEDDSDYSQKAKNRSIARSKGHSMSVDVRQSSAQYDDTHDDTFTSRSAGVVRRRNLSKENEDHDEFRHGNSDLKQDRNRIVSGRRVIIHQVTTTDTLAGIALYYGIQVSFLKKSNKLWTNDSIHTRKYLYIPFEECTVARQSGVTVDENNQTVLLPQRTQQPLRQHNRSGSVISPGSPSSSFAGRISSEPSIGPTSNSVPNAQQTNNLQAIMESGLVSTMGLSFIPENRDIISHPPISAVAAGMLPSSPLMNSPSRMSSWIDSKGTAAPPLPSPTITTTTSKSDNSLRATPLSPYRRNTSEYPGSTNSTGGLVPFSEDLPDTVIVSPSMTHESLAARFKEMDIISSEQQQRKQLGQEQELRINPIHQRHRTTDLRHLANMQQIAEPGKRSLPTSTTGSRRTSVDVNAHGPSLDNTVESVGRRGPLYDGGDANLAIEERVEGEFSYEEEEEADNHAVNQRKAQDPNRFVTYGHHQHIYETDDLLLNRGSGGTIDRQSDYSEPNDLRRQELITVPAGMLSFFPSSEHSKRLETPQSISRIQNRMEEYHRLSSSLSSSSSTGSIREALSSHDGSRVGAPTGSKSKGRMALNDQTFQSPRGNSSTVHTRSSTSTQYTKDTPSSSSDILHNNTDNTKGSTYSKSLRLNSQYQQQYFTPQKWSAIGESLVDDLLGAVRGPLQIARRVYNFTTFGFGVSNGSSSGSKDSLDFESSPSSTNSSSSSPASIRRKSSSRGRRSQRNKEYRYSGSAIELDQAIFQRSSTTTTTTSSSAITSTSVSIIASTKSMEPVITRRVPTVPLANADAVNAENCGQSGRTSRRKSNSGHGHFSGSSSSSTRKRSLRSSNPVNHAALMALVNELDKDKREKEKEKDITPPTPFIDTLTTSV